MLRFIPLLVLVALFAACSSTPERAAGEFLAREIVVDGVRHRYQVFVPAARAGGRRPPVILFLHGSGERGVDNEKQLTAGLGPHVRARRDRFPAIVVFPQAPEGSEWYDHAEVAFAALDAATRDFGGDRERTSLTGLSMGGYGVWELALRQPQRFAAVVPICGGITPPGHRPTLFVTPVAGAPDPFAETARRLRAHPIWIFHGAEDDLVLPEQSRRMAAALAAAGAPEARYTEFPDANHNSWDPAYATDALWPWLFAQRRARTPE